MECSAKIFVGNVPFQCNQSEFEKCFEGINGYVKAEIVYKPSTNISRGFGFVTFDSQKNAEKIIGTNNIIFKDRVLRFTEYSLGNLYDEPSDSRFFLKSQQNKINNEITNMQLSLQNKNFLLVKNINNNTTRKDLYEIFNAYGDIGKYFIATDRDTGNPKNYGIVEIIDTTLFELLVKQKDLIVNNDYKLELTKWKHNTYSISNSKKNTPSKIQQTNLFK